MNEFELLAKNYRNGGNNYILKANLENRWVAFSKSVIKRMFKRFKNDFYLVIYWNVEDGNVSYYRIPYSSISHLLTDEHLTVESNGEKRRWTFTVVDNLLCVHANTLYSVDISNFLNNPISLSIEESGGEIISRVEGDSNVRFHKRIERDCNFIRQLKFRYQQHDSLMHCQICGFSYAEKYGDLGKGYIEAHHKIPLSKLEDACQTKESDIIFVCANCHRMIHSTKPEQTIENIKTSIR